MKYRHECDPNAPAVGIFHGASRKVAKDAKFGVVDIVHQLGTARIKYSVPVVPVFSKNGENSMGRKMPKPSCVFDFSHGVAACWASRRLSSPLLFDPFSKKHLH